jgi:ribulose-5-phosphate 4-epimerase/fuculose-1-phosphate aldolase
LGLIGVYEPSGIGFGNISMRIGSTNTFIISASATGQVPKADSSHFCKVHSCDIDANEVKCQGPMKASSESMSHFALYKVRPDLNSVIHVHHRKLWKYLLATRPFTSARIPYGTPEMAREVQRLAKLVSMQENGAFAMAGHEDGVVILGRKLEEGLKTLEEMHNFVEEGERDEGGRSSRHLGGPEN